MMKVDCKCTMVFEVDPAYIPSNMPSTTAGNNDFVAVKQYECLRCGTRWGYLGYGVRLIKRPESV